MRKRTKAREYALQILYQSDIRRADARTLLAEFWRDHEAVQESRDFASALVTETVEHLDDIDRLITAHAENWNLKRMAVVDRNILRLGACELVFRRDAPPSVCINEAIELAKRFGAADSGKFINGVLDAIHKRPQEGASV
ncbi:MAG TPA: transcription antitermination factor NusB [bacterium]